MDLRACWLQVERQTKSDTQVIELDCLYVAVGKRHAGREPSLANWGYTISSAFCLGFCLSRLFPSAGSLNLFLRLSKCHRGLGCPERVHLALKLGVAVLQ